MWCEEEDHILPIVFLHTLQLGGQRSAGIGKELDT